MKSQTLTRPHRFWGRVVLFLAGISLLAMVYIFQRVDLVGCPGELRPNTIFIVNRTFRLILNDIACFLIILAIFKQKKYLKMAFIVFLVELVVILPAYLVVKLTLEGDSEISSPLLSQIHRLIVNPMLMILLIGGFFYQQLLKR